MVADTVLSYYTRPSPHYWIYYKQGYFKTGIKTQEYGFEWTRKGLIFYNSGSEISDLLIHEEQDIKLIFNNPKV